MKLLRTPRETHVIWTLSTCQTSLPPQGLCTCCLTTRFPSHLATSFSVQIPNVKTQDLIDRIGQCRAHACVLYNFIYMANKKNRHGKRVNGSLCGEQVVVEALRTAFTLYTFTQLFTDRQYCHFGGIYNHPAEQSLSIPVRALLD